MSEIEVDTGESAEDTGPRDTNGEPLRRSPTTKPALLKLVATVLVTAGILGWLVSVYGPRYRVMYGLIVLFGTLLVLRQLYRVFLLSRTTYRVTPGEVRREYSLLFRSRKQVLELGQLRGHEVTRSRAETLLGYGSVRFLTGGADRGVGFLVFENVENPEELSERITARRDALGGV